VILHHAYAKPKTVVVLLMAVSWHIRVPITKPLTDYFPNSDIWPKKVDSDLKTTLDSSTKDAKRKRVTTNKYARNVLLEGTKHKYKSKIETAAMFNKPHSQTSSNEDRVSIKQGLYDKDGMTNNAACESLEDDEAEVEGNQDLNMINLEDNNDDNNSSEQMDQQKRE
jgi:hypothetical protein